METYEKLGAFYLGRTYDLQERKPAQELVLYDSRDLVTHAVVVGMTGSGKTGLCVTLLEEAAIDGIPAIVIDPKGDLTNLLLTFPELRPQDFRPWVNEEDARRQGLDLDSYAVRQADLWRRGLADWSQDGARIQRLRDSAEFVVYTPGSDAGLPVAVLKSFAAPPPQVVADAEAMRDRVAGATAGLLGLMGIEADPLQSREHILLSTILNHAWSQGQDLDMPALVAAIQNPPFSRLGVMELESFFPAADRFALAVRLNNLIASPDFGRWLDGEPLDIAAMLYSRAGKPRVAVFSIAHLNDAERMFFVSLLLNTTLSWVRSQSGTTSLRALLYMDEIAGYFPPVANPPSKAPLLTLMKQARAFGLGLVLATQNPVDLDYKGLANAGTWFIGRLQTQRDKDRVLDGLEGAAAGASGGFDRAAIDKTLSQLSNRVFLMNNVHEDAPAVIHTRWAMSYLRGPLTRQQIRTLMEPYRRPASEQIGVQTTRRAGPLPVQSVPAPTVQASAERASRPMLPPGVRQAFIPARSLSTGANALYRPMLLATGTLRYTDTKMNVDQEARVAYLVPLGTRTGSPVQWESAQATDLGEADLDIEPAADASFAPLPPEAANERSYQTWKKDFADMMYRECALELYRSASLKEVSRPGESEREFQLRIAQAARERRDEEVDRLRQKYASRLSVLQERLRRAQQAVEVQQEQSRASKLSTAVSFGGAILSALLGRKKASVLNVGRAGSAVRGVGRSMKEAGDVRRAAESVEAVQQQITDLEAQLQSDVDALGQGGAEELERITVRPKKSSIAAQSVLLAWEPCWETRPE
ncbi:MAG: ATP-binding protein [Planctomycetes bacterium]|nr:ATP-binding protein [Planctomycetota bacterium]